MVRAGFHALAALVGFAIIGCVVHASIMAQGGYSTAAAPLMITLGIGLGVGSIAVGTAWSERRWFVTAGLILALAAGEMYALLLTAERITSHRETQQAPLKTQEKARTKAAERIADAEQAVKDASKDTPRLTRALAAKKAADEAAVSKSAEKGCAKNCRALLEQQVAGAAAEVVSARAEASAGVAAAKRDLAAARAVFAEMPNAGSASPFADRLGIDGWTLDVTAAVLASLAANGLGAMLIAFGVHGLLSARHGATNAAVANELKPVVVEFEPVPMPQAAGRTNSVGRRATQKALPKPEMDAAAVEADLFARASLVPYPKGRVYLRDLPLAYSGWCQQENRSPRGGGEMAAALNALFACAGLHTEGRGIEKVVIGIDWKHGRPGEPVLVDLGTHSQQRVDVKRSNG